jgi:hypothetical protein
MFGASTMGFGPDDLINIGTIDGGTVYGSDGGGSWWDNWGSQIFNQGISLGSQIIGAWGRNPTQQIGTVPGVGQGYSPAAVLQAQGQNAAAIAAQQQALLNASRGQSGGVGSTVGGGVDGIINWAAANPIPVFLGIAGVFLLFRQPPGRR